MFRLWLAFFNFFCSLGLAITYLVQPDVHNTFEYSTWLHLYNLVGWFCALCLQITVFLMGREHEEEIS